MFAPLHSLPKSDAIACKSQDVRVVNQPVNERGCQAIIAKYLIPLTKLQIRRHNHTPPLVTIGNHVEQAFRIIPRLREDRPGEMEQIPIHQG